MDRHKSKALSKALEKKLKQETKHKQLILSRDKGVFDNSLKSEVFGSHPGYVDLRIEFSIYSPSIQDRSNLSSLRLEFLCGSYEEAKEIKVIIELAITNWIAGWEHREIDR